MAFSLAASDGTMSQQTLSPDPNSDTTVTVDVPVPADTEPGEYEVTLTATAVGEDDTVIRKRRAGRLHVGGEQTRSGFMTYRVVAPRPHPQPTQEPPAPAPDPAPAPAEMPPATEMPPPTVVPVPTPVGAPRARRARLALSLTALPRRALSGTNVSYRVVARNVSRVPALRARVCAQLPRAVQFVRATAGVRFDGSQLCFARNRLAPGAAMAARLVAHIDLDAEGGLTRARARASAANASRVHALAPMRIVERPRRPGGAERLAGR